MKKAYGCILCVLILLAGCGTAPGNPDGRETDAGAWAEGNACPEKTYAAETWDAGITPAWNGSPP